MPGPEAYELACYFGYISRGIIGALCGGFGFAFPGCVLELIFSFIYAEYGIGSPRVQASFQSVRLSVAAMIFRATYKLAEHVLNHHETKVFQWDRGYIFLFNFLVRTTLVYIYVCIYHRICCVYVFLFKNFVCVMVYVYMLCVYTMCMCMCMPRTCMFEERDPYTHIHTRILYMLDCHNRPQFLRLPRC